MIKLKENINLKNYQSKFNKKTTSKKTQNNASYFENLQKILIENR
jgi:hypothetical protein